MTQAPTPGPLSGDFNVEEYVADYEFRADEGSYSPTENERALLIDAIHGALSEASFSLAPTAPVEASGSERERLIEVVLSFPETVDLPTQRAEDLANEVLDALRPQPSGETREQCAACSRGEVTHFSTDDGFWVEITTSAGGANEHGLNGWFETLEHYPDGSTKRREYVATDSPALSTTPARAEAQDEGAAGKREQAIKELIAGYAVMHEVICFMAGTSGAAGRWYYEKANAAFEKVKPLHVFGNDLATHPSPTPAADADRVRIAVEALEKARDRINVTRGPMGSFYRTESSAEALYEAKVAVGIGLSALKSTAAKEGGE